MAFHKLNLAGSSSNSLKRSSNEDLGHLGGEL